MMTMGKKVTEKSLTASTLPPRLAFCSVRWDSSKYSHIKSPNCSNWSSRAILCLGICDEIIFFATCKVGHLSALEGAIDNTTRPPYKLSKHLHVVIKSCWEETIHAVFYHHHHHWFFSPLSSSSFSVVFSFFLLIFRHSTNIGNSNQPYHTNSIKITHQSRI